ncbi:MAG: EamA family transporter [Clostridia bacterium]|nr:EamA family transporter [Clostridia bacterium]
MIFSMMIFGTISVFVRYLSLSSSEIALYRSVIAAFPIGLFLFFRKRKERSGAKENAAKKKEILLLIGSGAALGINWILLFEAYRHTTVSTATLCYYTAPVIVTAVSLILFRERLTKLQLFCFLMSVLGFFFLMGFSDLQTDGAGIAFGLGAAGFYALVILLNKGISGVEGLERTFLQMITAAAVLLPYVIFFGGFHLHLLDFPSWMVLMTVGLLHTGLAYCLYFTAIAGLKGQQIALLSYVDPLTAVLISVFLLSETTTVWQMTGGILILVFSFLNEWSGQCPSRIAHLFRIGNHSRKTNRRD